MKPKEKNKLLTRYTFSSCKNQDDDCVVDAHLVTYYKGKHKWKVAYYCAELRCDVMLCVVTAVRYLQQWNTYMSYI